MTFWSILRQRCWGLVLVVAGVCVITFIISHLIPGDPARLLAGDRASDAIVENIRQQLGLDQPLYVQFYRYVSDLFHGDLGTSIRTGRPVLEELRIFFPATLELAFGALLLALLIGIPLGILSAVWRNRWLDHLVRIMAITGISTPAFWLGLGVIVLFYGHLQILPGGGRLDDWLDPPTHVTGFYLLDALLEGNGVEEMQIPDAVEVMSRYPFELSGGMRQRVMIALAFSCEPQLIIADEPTTALDVTVQLQVLRLLKHKARASGTAVLFISHDMAVVSQLCDSVYVMYAGSVIESGVTADVIHHPRHPYTIGLLQCAPEHGVPRQLLPAIPGTVPNLTHLPDGCAFRDRCYAAGAQCENVPALTACGDNNQRCACWYPQQEVISV
ncbi:oligopeptide/dipeptide ABC transporter ATP-binding protein [Escherichia coli]|uniref:oligopeptide/dipeptide ABC transporter ATP-binding protein n=2 Tax=Escherichia coli TaxID=562 RepID=UPI0038B5B981